MSRAYDVRPLWRRRVFWRGVRDGILLPVDLALRPVAWLVGLVLRVVRP